MHRNDRIALTLATLEEIEHIVARSTTRADGKLPSNEHIQARIDNAVRIYCAGEIVTAIYANRE